MGPEPATYGVAWEARARALIAYYRFLDDLLIALERGNPRPLHEDVGARNRVGHKADHVRRERWLPQIEAQWGPAPGRQSQSTS